jgi:hypothetical protein
MEANFMHEHIKTFDEWSQEKGVYLMFCRLECTYYVFFDHKDFLYHLKANHVAPKRPPPGFACDGSNYTYHDIIVRHDRFKPVGKGIMMNFLTDLCRRLNARTKSLPPRSTHIQARTPMPRQSRQTIRRAQPPNKSSGGRKFVINVGDLHDAIEDEHVFDCGHGYECRRGCNYIEDDGSLHPNSPKARKPTDELTDKYQHQNFPDPDIPRFIPFRARHAYSREDITNLIKESSDKFDNLGFNQCTSG